MIEQWIKWEPINNLANKYYIEAIYDGIDGFSVILFDTKDRKNKIKVIFADSVDSYCRTDESFRLVIINELSKRYGADFYGDWTFFKVTNSIYIKWLSEQSYSISDDRSFIHFCFIAADSILDVITNYEPKVELLGWQRIIEQESYGISSKGQLTFLFNGKWFGHLGVGRAQSYFFVKNIIMENWNKGKRI